MTNSVGKTNEQPIEGTIIDGDHDSETLTLVRHKSAISFSGPLPPPDI